MAINKVEFGDEVLIDLTEDTVTEETLLEGETAHDASGNPIRGRAKSGASEWDEIANKPFERLDNDTVYSENGTLKAKQTTVDDTLSKTSTNPVQNKVISEAFEKVISQTDVIKNADVDDDILTDSADAPIKGMKIYGKCVQDGTPTPESPVEIQSVVNPVVKMCGKNIVSFPYKSKNINSKGVDFTLNADGSISANGTNTGGGTSDFVVVGGYTTGIPNEYSRIYKAGIYTFGMYGRKDLLSYIMFQSKDLQRPMKGITVRDKTVFKIEEDFVIKFWKVYAEIGQTIDNETVIPLMYVGDVEIEEDFPIFSQATLPYTLNAIPVSSGGNVTIDGQQYIADYVDVERKKLVLMTEYVDVSTLTTSNIKNLTNCKRVPYLSTKKHKSAKIQTLCNRLVYEPHYSKDSPHIYSDSNAIYLFIPVGDELPAIGEYYVLYALLEPIEIDLTDEEVQTLLALHTYAPTTNIVVTSDDLDGACEFIYYVNGESGQEIGKLLSKIGQEDISSVGANVTDAINKLASDVADNGDWLKSKNLLPCTVSSNGIFTVNTDGSVKAKGTPSGTAILQYNVKLPIGSYVLNGCPSGGSNDTYSLQLRDNNNTTIGIETGNGYSFTLEEAKELLVLCRVASGTTVDVTYYPMIRKAGTDSAYVPYVKSNVELTSELKYLERSVATLPIPSDVTYTSSNTHDVIRSFGVCNIRYQILGYVGIGNYQTIGILPDGYKPNAEMLKRICVDNNVFGYFRIKTNGEVQINIENGTTTSLYINEVFLS